MSSKRARGDDEYEDIAPPKKRSGPRSVPAPTPPQIVSRPAIDVLASIQQLFPLKAALAAVIHQCMAPQNGGIAQPILLHLDYIERDIPRRRDVALKVTHWYGFGPGTVREPRIETDVKVPGYMRCQCGNEAAFKQFFFMDIGAAESLTEDAFKLLPRERTCATCTSQPVDRARRTH